MMDEHPEKVTATALSECGGYGFTKSKWTGTVADFLRDKHRADVCQNLVLPLLEAFGLRDNHSEAQGRGNVENREKLGQKGSCHFPPATPLCVALVQHRMDSMFCKSPILGGISPGRESENPVQYSTADLSLFSQGKKTLKLLSPRAAVTRINSPIMTFVG
jgi:hypothetical protein